MQFTVQRRLAADMMGCSPSRVKFEKDSVRDIKEAVTKRDIRKLIKQGVIAKIPKSGNSNFKSAKIKVQKSKGRRRGAGSRKGKFTARENQKETWMNKVRSQRRLLQTLKEKEVIDSTTFRSLYQKVKGGFFRNQRHLRLFIQEHHMAKES